MDSFGKKKIDPRTIDEKAILKMVAAKGTQKVFTSGNPQTTVTQREQPSNVEGEKSIKEEDVQKYIQTYLNDFSSPQRKPLHIDAEVYECISDIVWSVRRKDFTVSGFISRVLTEHLKENADLIKVVTGRNYKLFEL